MNSTTLVISKITERGQITLPKKIRDTRLFSNARAVLFSQVGETVTITPIRETKSSDDHVALLDSTMSDWSDPVNDDLFDFTKCS